MARGLACLVAIAGWFSRRVPAWRLSITMTAGFCVEALEEALGRFGKPDMLRPVVVGLRLNTDQGSQFTSEAFTGILQRAEIAISIDGWGAWRDNLFALRLWRSIKSEEVYLHAFGSVPEARAGIGRYLGFYNSGRAVQFSHL